MADLARRTWEEMRDEVLVRLGREGNAASEARAEHWVDAAYRLVCQGWHHFELDTTTTLALAAAATSVALPADCFVVVGVNLLDNATGAEVGNLVPLRAGKLLASNQPTGVPKKYARFGDTLHVDAAADVAYDLFVSYYTDPDTPDFSAGSPSIDRVFDQVVIEGATELGQKGYWAAELGAVARETMATYLGSLPYPPLSTGSAVDRADAGSVDRPYGGPQG